MQERGNPCEGKKGTRYYDFPESPPPPYPLPTLGSVCPCACDEWKEVLWSERVGSRRPPTSLEPAGRGGEEQSCARAFLHFKLYKYIQNGKTIYNRKVQYST